MISALAHAKINLALHITGKRADGYHLLDSLVVFASTHDEISVKPATELTLLVKGTNSSALAGTGPNLVLQAAEKLREFASIDDATGAQITLSKQLPVSAGIGGGSADAAATLHALNALWDLNLSDRQLAKIGLSLGADIPVCLNGSTSRMSGIGENVLSISHCPKFHLVLVNSGVKMSTPSVFKALKTATNSSLPPLPSDGDLNSWFMWLKSTRNDLSTAALSLDPALKSLVQALEKTNPVLTRMSGSGATFFGMYKTPGDAEQAATAIRNEQPGWWVQAVATV
ncbi:MAG: 4-(cytidine 5'-diphospho)-2-C-methyl-D-erythritol kinase [Rhizobiales bacterium]|nr:4-(cytidine 5'-diphospho)-2-C-methyl-D-erythritol kinase [Hyphomicrobiales bacterium]